MSCTAQIKNIGGLLFLGRLRREGSGIIYSRQCSLTVTTYFPFWIPLTLGLVPFIVVVAPSRSYQVPLSHGFSNVFIIKARMAKRPQVNDYLCFPFSSLAWV